MKIIHVHFKRPYEGKENIYFGSFAAIYDNVPKEAMGVSEGYHCDTCRKDYGFYENKKVDVKLASLSQRKINKELMTVENPLCFKCKHYCHNHGDGTGYGCKAFPYGIPDQANYGHTHHKVIEGQVGEFVYEEAKFEELPPFGKYLWDNWKTCTI